MSNLAYYSDTGAFDPAAALRPGHDPYSDVGWFGSDLVKKIGKAAKTIAKGAKLVGHVVSGPVNKAMPFVQAGLKSLGPIGMVASGALGTMKAALDGKSLKEIGLAAAIGAAPLGIDRALAAGVRIAKGDNLIKIGLDELGKGFKPGSAPLVGFDVAKKLLSKGSGKELLAAARRNLTTEEMRRGFDTAVGQAARLADKVGIPKKNQAMAAIANRANILAGNRGPKPVDVLAVNVPRNRSGLPSLATPQVSAALKAMQSGATAAQAAKRFGAPLAQLRRGLGTRIAPRVSWRPLSSNAASFVQRHAQHTPATALRVLYGRDTMGLVDGGKVYVVESGDFPGKIAKKLTGKDTLWPQLIAANPQKKTKQTNIGKVFVTLNTGERLNVPKSWNVTAPDPIVVTAPSSSPSQVDSANVNTAAILQAKGLLITWNKTDGSGEAGPTDYGVRPEDMATAFGPRDKLVALAFENWSNRKRGTKLAADGAMNAELSEALRAWAEERSSLPVPAVPSLPPVVSLPSSPAPATPVVTAPPVTAPALPAPVVDLPVSFPAPVVTASPGQPQPAPELPQLPPLGLPGGAVVTVGPKPAAPASSGGGDALVPLAAVVGGLLFGHPLLGLAAGGALLAAQSK